MRFTFSRAFSDHEVNNAVNMTGAEIKLWLAQYLNQRVDQLTILINNQVLGDHQTPLSHGAKDSDVGFCFIYIEEISQVDPSSSGLPSFFQDSRYDSFSNSRQAPALSAHELSFEQELEGSAMLDEEYVKQEMESGKYSGPLRELDTYSVLYEHFMSSLKKVDSRLHDVFERNPALLQSYIHNSHSLPQGEPAFTLLTDETKIKIYRLMEEKSSCLRDAIHMFLYENGNKRVKLS